MAQPVTSGNTLPYDVNWHRVQVGTLATNSKLAFTDTSDDVALTGTAKWLYLIADAPCHIKFGSETLTADVNDFLLPADKVVQFGIANVAFVAAIRHGGDGTLFIMEVD